MSTHTISAGNFILLDNSGTDLDVYLINQAYLSKRINDVKVQKTKNQQDAIKSRNIQIANLKKAIVSGTLDNDTIINYNELINQLQDQINKLKHMNVNADMKDIDKSHFIFLNQTFKPTVNVSYVYYSTSVSPLPIFGSTNRFQVPYHGDFFTDMMINLTISPVNAVNKNNKVKYCDFPAHKLIKTIRFIIDGNIIDEYTNDDINFYYQFHISESQKHGWKRCVGQETPKRCFLTQDPLNQEVREEKVVYDGYQTYKYKQPELNIFLPLNFWFCDPKFAMSNNNITYYNAFIEYELADYSEILICADYEGSGDGFIKPSITQASLISNHIFLTPEVANLVVSENVFNLIRVHRNLNRIVDKPYDQILLNELKFAVEDMYIYFRPISNSTDANTAEIWHNNNDVNYTELSYPSILSIAGVKALGYTNSYYYSELPTVDVIGLISEGSTIYDNQSTLFYDSYLPFRFGRDTVMTPIVSGSYLMTFNLYPDKDQPSGYINFSNARENYLTYSSSYISKTTPCNLHISAKTINFIYLSKGSFSVRFTT
jgi:hypothetical protein